jgi:hypothetical protein
VVKPPGLAAGAKGRRSPFIVHGGPQSSLQNQWNWRWNAQAVRRPRLRCGAHRLPRLARLRPGVHGFHQPALGRWSARRPQEGPGRGAEKYQWLDGKRACSLGASYGGYMQNWIQSHWADGFRCIVNHAGIFDTRSMYYTTEELWFTEWEFGGPYFDNPEMHERFNPANYVKGLAYAHAGDPRGEGLPRTLHPGHRDLHHAAAAWHRKPLRGVPRRGALDPEAGEQQLLVRTVLDWLDARHEVRAYGSTACCTRL